MTLEKVLSEYKEDLIFLKLNFIWLNYNRKSLYFEYIKMFSTFHVDITWQGDQE